jgi:uncharacterized protein YjbI with pentapeptide repeats
MSANLIPRTNRGLQVKKFLSIFLAIQLISSIFSLPWAQATSCPTVSAAGVVSPALQINGVYLNCSFAGAKLNNIVIDSVTITSADFSGADFRNTTIKNSTISTSDFTGANFTSAIFENSTLTSAVLNNTILSDASFSGMTSSGLTGTPLSMSTQFKIVGGKLLCPYAKLDGIDLTGVDLTSVNLTGASLKNSTLVSARGAAILLNYADLTNANLSSFTAGLNTWMENAILTGANLRFADLRKAGLKYAVTGSLLNADSAYLPTGWHSSSGYLIGKYADLTGATFNNVSFSGWDMYGVNLTDATLTSVNLTNADLRHANFARATITNSTITGTNLYAASMSRLKTSGLIGTTPLLSYRTDCILGGFYFGSGVNLTNSNLSNLNLFGCELTSADISGSTVTGTRFFGAYSTFLKANDLVGTPFSLSQGITFKYQTFLGPSVNLTGADLHGKDLTSIDFSSAWMEDCNLSDANFSDAIFTNARIVNSNISNTNFQSTTLTQIYTSNLTGQPINLPTDFVTKYGYLLGPGVVIVDAEINDLDFSNLNLSGAYLGGVDAIGTDFTNTNLTGASFLSGILTGADFSSAIISGANIDYADFSEVTFDHTVASGLVGTPKTLPDMWFIVDGNLLTVPNPVANLSPTNVNTSSMTISWAQPTIIDNSDGYTYAVRYKSDDLGSTWIEISNIDTLSKSLTSLSSGKEYEVQVSASNAASAGSWSQSVKVEIPNALAITNTTLSNPANVSVTLTSSGGLGNVAITFSVEGTSCALSGSTLSATAPVTCEVTATKNAQGIYAELMSSTKNFTFSAVAQPVLELTNQTTVFPVTSETSLQVTGGAGIGSLTYTVTGTHCFLDGDVLSADMPTQCTVRAKKAASGIYLEAISQTKVFTFFDVAVPAAIVVTGLENSESNSLIFNQYLQISVSTNATVYSVTTDSNCKLSLGKLTANKGSGFCLVTVTVPAVQNMFTQTIYTKQVKLGLAQIQVPVLTVPKIGKTITLMQTHKIGTKSASLKWVSSTLKICTITAGKLKALKKGTCKLTVSSVGIQDYISPLAAKEITLSIK